MRLLGAAAMVAVPLVPLSVATEASAAPKPSVRVVIEALTPQIPAKNATLRLRGRLVNTGKVAIDAPAVVLRISPNPLTTRSEIAPSARNLHEGNLVAGAVQALGGTLKPGESVAWSLHTPVAALNLHTAGVYPMNVAARAGGAQLGQVKTFLPWMPDRVAMRPTNLVMLWPLVDRPRQDATGVFTDDTLAAELAPDGRLGRLLAAPAPGTVSWVVDPDLLRSVADLANGYRVRDGTAARTGTGTAVARQWLARLDDRLAGNGAASDVVALPYADPDLVALQRSGLRADINALMAQTRARTRKNLPAARTDVIWPPDNALDRATLLTLIHNGVSAVVLDDANLALRKELTFTPTGRASLRLAGQTVEALLADTALTDLLATADATAGGSVLAGQQFLAETMMITAELPQSPRTILVTPPRRWNPDRRLVDTLTQALRQAPWLHQVTLRQLQDTAASPGATRKAMTYPATARAEELPAVYLRKASALRVEVRRYTSILSEPAATQEAFLPAALRSESVAWRHTGRATAYALDVRADLVELERKVRIISRDSVTLSSKSGTIPITVTNESTQAVTVGLRMRSAVSSRLRLTPVPMRRINPAQKVTFEVPAEAASNGTVLVKTQLVTPAGTPYGRELSLKVRATNYGTVGMLVVGSTAATLLAIVLVRRFRGRRAAVSEPRPEPVAAPR